MATLQQIEEEMQRENVIDKKIEKIKKIILKQPSNRKYRIIPTKDDADVVLLFDRSDLRKYSMILYKKHNEFIDACVEDQHITAIFLKNKNPHDSKASTYGDIQKTKPKKKTIK